ncbi:hypothetical protein [uncultured Psychroserpens sp.]|uniref:hypothetical protein n=1 Tax=uncultured Psychroserpens sp. TaxID=255436 RepID=UPI00261328CF|nr:hypothetical protein [uncultured Psychroserpens sp.]
MRKLHLTFLICLFIIIQGFGQIIDIGNEITALTPTLNGVYCPNVKDDTIGPGGLDFNGRVKFNQTNRWWIDITDSESILYLDIQFSFEGVNNPNVFVKGSRRFKVFGISDLKSSIVGFRQENLNGNGFSNWARNSYGYASLDMSGDGGVFCDDDNSKDISAYISGGANDLKFFIDVQGDTGGSDISDDRNCSCDTRVLKLWWNQKIQVAIATDIDHDGLQDSNIYPGLPIDRNVQDSNTNKRILYVNITKLKTPVHNDDCRKIQGEVTLQLFIDNDGDIIGPIKASGTSKLINWEGNKSKDFYKRNLDRLPKNTVAFVVEEDVLEKGNYYFDVDNSIKRCHKKCGLCSDYNCNMIYYNEHIDGIPISNFGVEHKMVFYLQSVDRRNYNPANHDLTFDISLTAN